LPATVSHFNAAGMMSAFILYAEGRLSSTTQRYAFKKEHCS
jgi:hypothetical protein